MESDAAAPPVFSTPAEHKLVESTSAAVPSYGSQLSEEQLYFQYEIERTIKEIRDGRWRRIALQFPDEMLVDAPRVFERLRDGLRKERLKCIQRRTSEDVTNTPEKTDPDSNAGQHADDAPDDSEVKLFILADTSYGACCVDEVAAEHVDAEVVVHYGRACLSPTARLPVIHVFTTKPLDIDAVVSKFKETYTDLDETVCLMADIPYQQHMWELFRSLIVEGYEGLYATDIVRDPSSLLPNRTLPIDVRDDPEMMKNYSVFHVSDPPTSLLLILSSRVKKIHIYPTSISLPAGPLPEVSTTAQLRRRYALLTRVSTVPIFGILINTLSVSNYMAALKRCQELIAAAGKKSYVFVVGKVNPAKIANFAEIGAWVVIGCWESSLIESKEFFAPIVTPFELEVALQGDERRQWGGEWLGNFEELLSRKSAHDDINEAGVVSDDVEAAGDWDYQASDDEPPEFDLRTGRYVSRTRPMGRAKPTPVANHADKSQNGEHEAAHAAPASSDLVQRPKTDVAAINGTVSPAAAFLREKRTWQGLGSDYEVIYERDEDGKIRGAPMEEGRSGVARGYAVGGGSEG